MATRTISCGSCGKQFSYDTGLFSGSPAQGGFFVGRICNDCDRERKEAERHRERTEAEEKRHRELLEASRVQSSSSSSDRPSDYIDNGDSSSTYLDRPYTTEEWAHERAKKASLAELRSREANSTAPTSKLRSIQSTVSSPKFISLGEKPVQQFPFRLRWVFLAGVLGGIYLWIK